MHWLQRSTLKNARVCLLKITLLTVYASQVTGNASESTDRDVKVLLSWVRCGRQELFKKLFKTLREEFDVVVRDMLDTHRYLGCLQVTHKKGRFQVRSATVGLMNRN